jgi:hypothetical protein
MITRQDLNGYGFPDLIQYFEYISESYTNGQIKQVKSLIDELSTKQLEQFGTWCKENDCSHLNF